MVGGLVGGLPNFTATCYDALGFVYGGDDSMKLAVALTVTVLIAAGAVASAKALIELGAANLRTQIQQADAAQMRH